MRKIAIALSKGGVGKTTTAVSLAAGMAKAGQRVLLVDMDAQGQVSKALGLRPEAGVAEIVMDDVAPEQAVVEAREGVWLLAGGQSLAGLKREIARKDFGAERTVAETLVSLEGAYDVVLVDTAPGWDTLMVNALFYADEVLSPVALEAMALQGMIEFARSLRSIQKYHPDLRLRYVLPTFMDRRVKKSTEILGRLRSYYGDLVCEPIRYNVRLSEAPGRGRTIFEYAPRSPGAEDYHRLSKKILADGGL
jgi:chromosome partitioning protein